ncbi:MAG: oligosaccharide flippase family protein, partial [Alistipes sp.]|nr:oligosaccharide flippase family protein [Alistipes sp.]
LIILIIAKIYEKFKSSKTVKGAMFGLKSTVVGLIGAVVAYFGADFLTGTLLNTPEGAICLRVLAPCIFIVAVLGVMRGYFQGLGTMIPTAISQIIEQIVNAVVAVAAAWYLYDYGMKIDKVLGTETAAPAYGASGSTLGTTRTLRLRLSTVRVVPTVL